MFLNTIILELNNEGNLHTAMSPSASENNGAITLTVRGKHASMTLEDAEEFMAELQEAIEKARSHSE